MLNLLKKKLKILIIKLQQKQRIELILILALKVQLFLFRLISSITTVFHISFTLILSFFLGFISNQKKKKNLQKLNHRKSKSPIEFPHL